MVIQSRSTTGVLILFLVLSPQLVLLVKTRIIFRFLNEVCIQATFRNESETTTAIESLQTWISMISLGHQRTSVRL